MAPRRNDELRTRIREKFEELKAMAPNLRAAVLRQTFDLPTWKINYYLRDPQVDRRCNDGGARKRAVTLGVKDVSLYDEEGIRAEALRFGVPEKYIKEMISRKLLRPLPLRARDVVLLRGHLIWSKPREVEAMGLPREAVFEARDTLRKVYSLHLRNPNILIHLKTRRFHRLSLEDQVALLRDPSRFINKNLRRIASAWSDMDQEVKASFGRGEKSNGM